MAARQVRHGFRAQPPDVSGEHRIARPRLVAALSERFDHRVTLLTAVAGAGKTTTLALAMEANRMLVRGVDVFVAADEGDRSPGVLLDAIAEELDAPLGADAITSIADAVWSRAPDDVAIIIDDAHHVIGSPVEADLAALVRSLPHNGHVVLVGRRLPNLALARLRSHGSIVEIVNDDMLLTDGELESLVARAPRGDATRGLEDMGVADLPRVVGLADLTLRFGQSAGTDFIWEEVLASLEAAHLEELRLISMFDEFDDAVARAVTGRPEGAALLVQSLPLVDRQSAGSYRFHALLRTALTADLGPDELNGVRVTAAEHAESLGDGALAVQLYSRSGQTDRALSAARRFVLGSTLLRTFGQLRTVYDAVVAVAPESALAGVLDAELRSGQLSRSTSHESIVGVLRAAAAQARHEGDLHVESFALFRAIQQGPQIREGLTNDAVVRLGELAEHVPYAAQVVRYARAGAVLGSDGADAALAQITPLDDQWDPVSEQIYRAGFSCLLGRFEDVAAELRTQDDQSLPAAVEAYHQYAVYFRGEVLPDIARDIHDASSFGISASRIVSPEVVTCSLLALMGAQADDLEVCESALLRAEHAAAWGCAKSVQLHIDASRAAEAITFDSEEAAADIVADLLAAVPIRDWPSAGHLTVLAIIYLLAPDTREAIDRCRFGPAQTVAVHAAQALIEARRDGASELAVLLPWKDHGVMRVHVIAPILVELAAAAAAAGQHDALDLALTVPGADRHLRCVAAGSSATAPHAAALLSGWPTPPSVNFRAEVLGGLVVRRDGEVLSHPDFDRRVRVQELFAALVEHRRLPRTRVCELLWPDLDRKKASGNLRVTLAYLNRALEPDRVDGEPFCIRVEGDSLVLHESVTSDLADFDRGIRQAMIHDRSGAPRAALERYEFALGLWRGDYLDQMDSEWVDPIRERVRFAVVNAMLRVGELTLARGEPEEALEWAVRARAISPLHDRAERLNATCRLATGDRAGALRTLRELSVGLAAVGLRPEIETDRLLERLVDHSSGTSPKR